jgi:hypothetical protein
VGTIDPLNRDGGNGFRYLIRFDRAKAASIVIREVKVVYRG